VDIHARVQLNAVVHGARRMSDAVYSVRA
jgi:hypothetical protein